MAARENRRQSEGDGRLAGAAEEEGRHGLRGVWDQELARLYVTSHGEHAALQKVQSILLRNSFKDDMTVRERHTGVVEL